MHVAPSDAEMLQKLVESGAADIDQALNLIKRKGLIEAEEETKKRMMRVGRCPVCTLKLPCKHYQEKKDFPKLEKTARKSEDSVLVSISTFSSPQPDPASPYTPTFTSRFSPNSRVALPPISHSPSPIPLHRKPADRSRSHMDSKRLQERKLKLIEKLDRYRAKKIEREIQRLEAIKKLEEDTKAAEAERERKRRTRQAQLKQEIALYQEKTQSDTGHFPRHRSNDAARTIPSSTRSHGPLSTHRKANTTKCAVTEESVSEDPPLRTFSDAN